jgi:hypothetical protein
MGGKHRYEPERHRQTWMPAPAPIPAQDVQQLGIPEEQAPQPDDRPWWSRLVRSKG